jgi:hypothetical protein
MKRAAAAYWYYHYYCNSIDYQAAIMIVSTKFPPLLAATNEYPYPDVNV